MPSKKIEHSLNITVTLFLCTKAAKKEFDSLTVLQILVTPEVF